MKTLLIVPFVCCSCLCMAQSLPGMQGPERTAARIEQERTGPVRRTLDPITVHIARYPSFTEETPQKQLPVAALLTPKQAEDAPRNEMPIAGETVYLVGGGYFMQERTERHAEQVGLSRTWPIGNEVIGIVIKSGYPEKYHRPFTGD